jgi:hypothetical protein
VAATSILLQFCFLNRTVSGERSRDEETFFAHRILAFSPEITALSSHASRELSCCCWKEMAPAKFYMNITA